MMRQDDVDNILSALFQSFTRQQLDLYQMCVQALRHAAQEQNCVETSIDGRFEMSGDVYGETWIVPVLFYLRKQGIRLTGNGYNKDTGKYVYYVKLGAV